MDGDVGTLVFAQLGITLNLCTRKVSKFFKVVKVMTTHEVYRQCQLPVVDLSNFLIEYEESLKHLFLHFQISKNFWMQIVSWLNDLNNT